VFDNNGGSDYDDISDFNKAFGNEVKKMDGCDITVGYTGYSKDLLSYISNISTDKMFLQGVSCRGLAVDSSSNVTNDSWRCRFRFKDGISGSYADVLDICKKIYDNCSHLKIEILKTEGLFTFNDEKYYALGQGE
jgi:hypothetical protein